MRKVISSYRDDFERQQIMDPLGRIRQSIAVHRPQADAQKHLGNGDAVMRMIGIFQRRLALAGDPFGAEAKDARRA